MRRRPAPQSRCCTARRPSSGNGPGYGIALRWITKAEADAGQGGFLRHGTYDPTRRSDPSRDFPATRFFDLIRGNAGELEDDMPTPQEYAAAVWAHPLKHRHIDAPAVVVAVDALVAAQQAGSGIAEPSRDER